MNYEENLKNKDQQTKSLDQDMGTPEHEKKNKKENNCNESCKKLLDFDKVSDWNVKHDMSKTREDVLGQSTPMNRSLEDQHLSYDKQHMGTYLDVTRAEVAEEFTKQQNERLEKLWQHQSKENKKMFEKFDESVINQKRNSTLREQHVRQMESMRVYYEDEISELKKELIDMKNTMFRHNKQDDNVKIEIHKQFQTISAANVELSAKCDVLETAKRLVEDQLNQANFQKQELESQCHQLVVTNQIINTRSREMKRIEVETTTKFNEYEEKLRNLQCDCDELTKERELLKKTNVELQTRNNRMVESNRKLTDKCHKIKEENRALRDRNETQENFIERTNKNVCEQQGVIEDMTRELKDGRVKWEVDRSVCNATQQRVDRLVVQNRDKDLIIQNLEKQIKSLDETLKEVTASTAKAGLNEIKESIRKDKQQLTRVMVEYDSLSMKHQEAQTHVQCLEDKLAESQNEGEILRKQLSELNVTRRNLENSLRQVLVNQRSCRNIVEQSSRKTWKQSENFNFFTGEPFEHEKVQIQKGREKNKEYMESTRNESKQRDKNELVHLSPISSRINALTNKRESLVSAEKRFLELNDQRRRLEAALIRIPASRMSKQEKQDKKMLEAKLDEVLKEIGQTRLKMRDPELA